MGERERARAGGERGRGVARVEAQRGGGGMTDEAGRQMIERAGERGVRSVERYWKVEAILLGNTDPVPYLSATVDLVVDVLHAVERRRNLFDGGGVARGGAATRGAGVRERAVRGAGEGERGETIVLLRRGQAVTVGKIAGELLEEHGDERSGVGALTSTWHSRTSGVRRSGWWRSKTVRGGGRKCARGVGAAARWRARRGGVRRDAGAPWSA